MDESKLQSCSACGEKYSKKANSCVQIQHVDSEMFLSYDTKALFKFNAKKHKNDQSGINNSMMNNTRLMGERLFNEVDDEDI